MTTPQAQQRKHIETGVYPPATYVLYDDLHVRQKTRVRRTIGTVKKVNKQILRPDKPWEGMFVWSHSGLIYDHDEYLFKYWYHCHDPGLTRRHPAVNWDSSPAYAVSHDCVHWHKPELGIVSRCGSKRNNLVKFPPYGGAGPLTAVFKNPVAKGMHDRYVAMGMARMRTPRGEKPNYWMSDGNFHNRKMKRDAIAITCGFYVYHSADGYVWRRHGKMSLSNSHVTDNAFTHGYDHDLKKWIIFAQARTAKKFRTMGVSFCEDLSYIPFPQEVLTPDELDPPDCQFNHMVAQKVPGGYAGLIVDFRPHEGCKKEPQFTFSRDARSWSRPAGREPFIAAGPQGAWDEMNVFVHNPVQVGDTVYISYHGSVTGNGSFFPVTRRGRTRYTKVGGWGTPLPDGRMNLPGIGLATLPRDRWAGFEPTGRTGELHTKGMYWAGRQLRVNADASDGRLRAELRDIEGRAIPGFTLAESDPLTRSSLNHTMTWQGKRMLPVKMVGARHQGTVGRMMSIRFHLDRAKLFTFTC